MYKRAFNAKTGITILTRAKRTRKWRGGVKTYWSEVGGASASDRLRRGRREGVGPEYTNDLAPAIARTSKCVLLKTCRYDGKVNHGNVKTEITVIRTMNTDERTDGEKYD
ncbi:hypothetical protein EVAR_74306_1 [Eumeta japonica]|uniref:Uncharacterized protein n=1 Tax=Eumeta variegata TaxID=151549 RepID=A0A4C1SFS4_EUMVA|nr:hypothetical protein EVAR_74306_1 [Eumeta japonica]